MNGDPATGARTTGARQPSLFDRLGREDGITGAVSDLYDRILGDEELAHFFDGVDIADVQRHQRELLTSAVGGPSTYTGRSLREAHEGLHIERHHVDLVIEHLAASLARAGVSPTDVATVISLVERLWTAQFWPA